MPSLRIENQLFPSIIYLARGIKFNQLIFCPTDHYPKMGGRNRYTILTAQGSTLLTIPLQGGRDQRTAAGKLIIDYQMGWPTRHWRTLASAYNRSPYFEYYAPALLPVYHHQPLRLWDFNMACWHLVNDWLGKPWELLVDESGNAGTIISGSTSSDSLEQMPTYQQVFGDAFVGNLSVLDALFNLGPNTRNYLESVSNWLTVEQMDHPV